MATFTWTGSDSTDWTDPGNWSSTPGGVPGSGDDVVIGTTADSPTLSASTTVNTIKINGTDELTLAGALTVLTVSNGITLVSTGQLGLGGGIAGAGTVAAAITASGPGSGAGRITATGGTLEVTGTITDDTGALVLTITGATDRLRLDAASTAYAVNFVSSGTLELYTNATLTLSAAMAIGAGTLQLDSSLATLTDVNGVTIDTGTITGAGVVNAPVTASGAAQITATGGTLQLDAGLADDANAVTLTIAGATDVLQLVAIPSTATHFAANTVIFGSSGTLALNGPAFLTVGTALAIGAGTLQLAGGSLTDASGVTISSGTITGAGTVAAKVTASGAAQITATGGLLQVTGAIADSGNALTLTIAGATDKLLLFAASAAHTVTFGSSGTLELDNFNNSNSSLTVGTAMAIGAGTLQLVGAVLTDASGVTIGTGTITGNATVAAAVTATGAATIMQNGGNLVFMDAVTDSGNALTLNIGAGGGGFLVLDAASTAHAVTFSTPSGNAGFLSLATGASLTVGTAMTLGAPNTLELNNATFNDASGVALGGGEISGSGTVNTGVSGAGTVLAFDGTLQLAGTVASGPTLAVGGGPPGAPAPVSVLSIENTAIAAAPIAINSSTQTLAIASTGNLTINGGAESITNGTISIAAGGQLSDSSGFTIGSGATLIGSGTVTGPISGTGIVEASGGTVELVNAIAAADGAAFDIGNSAPSALLLDNVPGAGNTFTFLGANGDLALANDTGFDDTISALNVGSNGAKTNFVDIEGHTVTIISQSGQGSSSGTVTLSDGAVLNLTNISSTTWLAETVGDGGSGTDIFLSSPACFCRGTLILTEAGERPVEALAIGDRVVTIDGTARPIKWIGRRSYAGRFIAGNCEVLPIIVKQGAFADGVPARDLWLSPHHALFLEGMLVPVEYLVNGVSVVRRDAVERVDYFHIELDTHDAILAEGAPAETFVDCDSRQMFHNAAEFVDLYPDEEPPRWAFCAPRVEDGAALEALWRRLARRAGIDLAPGPLQGHLDEADVAIVRGWARDAARPDMPVLVEILVDAVVVGRAVANHYRSDLAAAGYGHGRHGFAFALPQLLTPDRGHVVAVRRTADGAELAQSPRTLEPPAAGLDAAALAVIGEAVAREHARAGNPKDLDAAVGF